MRRNDLLFNSDKIFYVVSASIIAVRIILAIGYDCLHKELIAPDGAIYSASAMAKYDIDILKQPVKDREVMMWYWMIKEDPSQGANTYKRFAKKTVSHPFVSEGHAWTSIIGNIYKVIGYNSTVIRIINILMSSISAIFLYGIFRCRWALIVCLLLPTQVLYSMSMGRDFMRELAICFALWIFYLGSGSKSLKASG